MPIPTFTGLGPEPQYEDVVNKINTLVGELTNLMLNLDTLNVVSLNAEIIEAGTITSDQLAAGSITTDKLVVGAVTDDKLADGAVTNPKLADGAVDTDKLEDFAVTGGKIENTTISGNKIMTGAITANEIAADTITAGQIASNTITANEIASHTITADEIEAGTITATEIAASTITSNEIAANTITSNEIAANTITANELNVSQLSAISADLGTITAGLVTGAVIRTAGTGEMVMLSSVGLQTYDSSANERISIKTGGAYGMAGQTFLDDSGNLVGSIGSVTNHLLVTGAGQITISPIGDLNLGSTTGYVDITHKVDFSNATEILGIEMSDISGLVTALSGKADNTWVLSNFGVSLNFDTGTRNLKMFNGNGVALSTVNIP